MAFLNHPAQPQADFNILNQALRTALGEIKRLPNLPAIAGGEIILAEIQQMRRESRHAMEQLRRESRHAMEQLRRENREQFGRLHTVIGTNDYNSAVRVQNAYLSHPQDLLIPLLNPLTGLAIHGFPATPTAIEQMAEPHMDAVLQQLGLPIDGLDLAMKRRCLRTHIGLRAQMGTTA